MIKKYFYLFPKLFKFIIHGRFDNFLKKTPGGGVIHIGANSAQERDHYTKLGIKNVIWIEADPNLFKIAKKNILNEKYINQKIYNYLVTDRNNASYYFNIASNGGNSSSLYKLNKLKQLYPGLKYVKKIKLKGMTLKKIFEVKKINTQKYQTLIIDTEGSELLILKGANELLTNFKFIKLEVADSRLFKKNTGSKKIAKYLNKFNFAELKRTEVYKNSLGKVFDILYINRNINY
jgi:FkbM family methyltransferase